MSYNAYDGPPPAPPAPWLDSAFVHHHQQMQDYPSPAPSTAASPTAYTSDNNHQIESSIGPSRVMTRGQRRAAAMQGHSSRAQTPLYPLTPESYSPYAYAHSSRRAVSPALSTNTSVSSAMSPFSPQDVYQAQSYPSMLAQPSVLPTLSQPPVLSAHPPRPKQRKQRLFNVDRQAICQYHLDNPTARQEDIAARYGVERSTISKILKHKHKWLSVSKEEGMRVAKHRPSKFPEIESAMVSWLSQPSTIQAMNSRTKPLSDTRLREKARALAKALDIPEDRFKASSGWVENFKHRHGIRNGAWYGDGRNTNIARALGVGAAPPSSMGKDEQHHDEDDEGDHDDRADNEYHPHPLRPQPFAPRPPWSTDSSATSASSSSMASVESTSSGSSHGYHRQPWSTEHDQGHGSHPATPISQGHSSHEHELSYPQSQPHSSHASPHPQHEYLSSHQTQQQQHPADDSQHLQHQQPQQAQASYDANGHLVSQTTLPPNDQRNQNQDQQSQQAMYTYPPVPSNPYPSIQQPSMLSQQPSSSTVASLSALPNVELLPPLPPTPPLPDISPPSLPDAEAALNRVLLYLDTPGAGAGLLSQSQRDVLHEVKCMLFKLGAGIPL